MSGMDIKEFRRLLDDALEEDGFERRRLRPGEPKKSLPWVLPAPEVLPCFFRHPLRRPWGFQLSGCIGIEIPELSAWLREWRPEESPGIFHSAFVLWHIANDDLLGGFGVIHGEPPPIRDWVARIKHRLSAVPPTLDELIRLYRSAPEHLGGLAAPSGKPAWDFLLRWHTDRDTAPPVPQRLF